MIKKLTAKELEILLIIWNHKTATVKTVNEEQNKVDDVGYTTTLKLMQLMFEKGILTRKSEGKSHVYKANIDENEIQEFLLNRYTHTTFGKSAMKLVLKALGNEKADNDDLIEIKKYINNIE
ncbi:MAG: BlaI/MecI/CopY family transcriptional regulator [Bacteroidales bacterium]|nr:BlaI/MecI/CopY family transcriptional regulator [Bacteroidales bacterium]